MDGEGSGAVAAGSCRFPRSGGEDARKFLAATFINQTDEVQPIIAKAQTCLED